MFASVRLSLAAAGLSLLQMTIAFSEAAERADLIVIGSVITLDPKDRLAEAIAVRDGRIVEVGSRDEVLRLADSQTQIVEASGKSVVPGFIESHCHAVGVARGLLEQTYVELSSIGELQDWIRNEARQLPKERWIEVPRNEITRFKERRFPTPTELDMACDTHPVIYNAVSNKYVLNTLAMKTLGLLGPDARLEGGEIVRDESGKPRLLRGGGPALRRLIPPRPEHTGEEIRSALQQVLKRYNEVGITSIFERAIDPANLAFYRDLKQAEHLTTRVTATFRFSAKSAENTEKYIASLGLKPREGDDWIKAGPLKITIDGGIHWATTRLSEPYGPRRIAFYELTDPDYRGEQFYSVDEMQSVFSTASKLGWQMSCHVTGDEGTLRVLQALERVAQSDPSIRHQRFTLIHAYFPSSEIVQKCRELGVCVDTQGYLYYKDADTLAEVYGPRWAERFIGLGDWVRGGVPVGLNADHMLGLDSNHAMNSFNPLLMISIAVNRQTTSGQVYGPEQKLSRRDALRTVTQWPAYLSFDETNTGSLQKGMLADLAILDRDLLTCPAGEIAAIRVMRTIVGGRTVHQK
ncbi:MAG: amidohydrolase [Planctomycetota bacterium]